MVRSDVTRRNDPSRDNLVLNADGEPVTFADVDEKPSQPDLLLGRYSILETRASGGFGMVQVCWDTRLQRRVAIKLIPLADPDDPNILASTIQDAISEARTARMLGHPNIVTVLDFENDEDYA
ncbi:MAG: hypothetical protein IJH87_04825, partial [Atopobiaceae bacterium]|nr:hypothetical protein [Atopobiaceae bacterium]